MKEMVRVSWFNVIHRCLYIPLNISVFIKCCVFISDDDQLKITELNNYNPSILENGRRSRLDNLSDNFNDLIESLSDLQTNQHKTHIPDRHNKQNGYANKKTVDNNISDKLVNKLDVDSKLSVLSNDITNKLIFEETYKNKLKNRRAISTPSKRMKYRKFKYKQGSSTSMKKDMRHNDITKNKKIDVKDEEIFIIPELPNGVKMKIDILSTWGDKFYVGLNGIELFGSDGKIITVKNVHILFHWDGTE